MVRQGTDGSAVAALTAIPKPPCSLQNTSAGPQQRRALELVLCCIATSCGDKWGCAGLAHPHVPNADADRGVGARVSLQIQFIPRLSKEPMQE